MPGERKAGSVSSCDAFRASTCEKLGFLFLIHAPELPPRVGIIATILALVGAVKFAGWYPERLNRAKPAS